MSDNENNETNRRKRTSLVWQYFEKLNSIRVKCRICLHEMRYMGNTANALRHLKVKHDIDARPCGLDDPENVRRMRALSASSTVLEQTMEAIKNEQNSTTDHFLEENNADQHHQGRSAKSRNQRISNCEEETEMVDPYCSDNEPLMDLEDSKNYSSHMDIGNMESSQITNPKNADSNNNANASATKRKIISSLEEKKIIAETEYYREKAAYFRVQKHLSFLQAKKIKYELEQLYGK